MKKIICIAMLAILLTAITAQAEDWGVYFPKGGERHEANASTEHLLQFGARYMGCESEKVLYLTFDAGYETGLTPQILDTLKQHQVPAAFFLVGTYLRDYPEIVERIVNEGHIIGNHTMTHPDMSKIATKESFAKELAQVEEIYTKLTGSQIPKYYRPPCGTYNETNLRHAQELGYKTIFWSTAYKDWDIKNQPSRQEAFDKLLSRTLPGAIILLHNVSQTNADILDELITRYKTDGYRFESLDYLTWSQS